MATSKVVDLNEYRGWKDRMERAGGQASFSFSIPSIDIPREKEESDDKEGGDDA